MANTPHTSSPEKPERSMPQRHRTDPVLSIGTPPENCRNSSRDHELSGLRTVRSSFRTYATASPPVRSLSAAHGEGLPIIGQLLGHRRVETTVCHASCARLGPGIRRAYRRQHSSRYSLGVFASVPGALTRREQLMSSRGSCIGYKGGRAGREAVQALVRARPSRSLARAVIGV